MASGTEAHGDGRFIHSNDGEAISRHATVSNVDLNALIPPFPGFLRHLPAQDGLALIHFDEVRTSLRNGDVIGIGLDSSEVEFPPELFKSIYEVAGDLGVKRTAHAGEEGPAAYIKNALDHLLVDRIDHGIRLAEDRELLKRVAEERILLSVCPISNVFLRCVDSVRDLPIRAFLEHGVRFSINSDDPAYFGGNYILDNYVSESPACRTVPCVHRECSLTLTSAPSKTRSTWMSTPGGEFATTAYKAAGARNKGGTKCFVNCTNPLKNGNQPASSRL